ncbi:hypothetical protein CLI92_06180 [Vandammella animalimorsus]|uniref:Alkaline phytoceramidase n=1 Tax=Vandammella animalimorsus TaxID=2029117 RepID=A0A2A2T653_9BURK|nr:hypothetical protein [Vandammella animalimorsus]PAT32111.1 hypothetical protein CK626_06730 [Vandammella animalimorsus]PAX17130.1 hypothetical protein CLI92_06180 [Vandammella animalimorsus]PAX19103.1 hypothetical protein CLI93_10110 [Vandammella animalimorsus]
MPAKKSFVLAASFSPSFAMVDGSHYTARARSAQQLARWALLAFAALLALLAALLPPVQQLAHYHDFADQRGLLGLPNAMDVLTNLCFLAAAIVIARAMRQYRRAMQRAHVRSMPLWWHLCGLAALGFAATALGSGIYHLQPNDAGVLWDRLAMGIVFAAIVGLAVRQIACDASALLATALTFAASCASLAVWHATGNFTPWSVLQGGGMVLLLAIGLGTRLGLPRSAGMPALGLLAIIGWYLLCKVCELGDHALFEASAGLISGHSLKHVFAAAAGWPIARMLYNATPMRR